MIHTINECTDNLCLNTRTDVDDMAVNKRKIAIEAVKEYATKLQSVLDQSPKSTGASAPLPTPSADPEAVSEFASGLSEAWSSKYASQEGDRIKSCVSNIRKHMSELVRIIDTTYANHKEPEVPEDSDDAKDKWSW